MFINIRFKKNVNISFKIAPTGKNVQWKKCDNLIFINHILNFVNLQIIIRVTSSKVTNNNFISIDLKKKLKKEINA